MKIRLEKAGEITDFRGTPFCKVNAVACLADSIVVVDGENHRICQFAHNGVPVRSIGGFGAGDGHFKFPVAAFYSPQNILFIADWHNHRVVAFDDDLNRLFTYGHFRRRRGVGNLVPFARAHSITYSRPEAERLHVQRRLAELLRFAAIQTRESGASRFISAALGLLDGFAKPDGFCDHQGSLIITENHSHCIARYDYNRLGLQLMGTAGSQGTRRGEFRHPAGAASVGDRIFVADSHNHRIVALDGDLRHVDEIIGADSGGGFFYPFGLLDIGQGILVTCGGRNAQFIDLETRAIISVLQADFEGLHGLASNRTRDLLYLADRLNNRVCVYRFEIVRSGRS
jgi:hypothetical protein